MLASFWGGIFFTTKPTKPTKACVAAAVWHAIVLLGRHIFYHEAHEAHEAHEGRKKAFKCEIFVRFVRFVVKSA